MRKSTESKTKATFFGAGKKREVITLGMFPPTHLDRLLNDLQGNTLLMLEDEGLARFSQARLRDIRANALAQAAGACVAAAALRQFVREWAGAGWLGTPAGRVLRDHIAQLRQDSRRWRQLAEYAARYLTYPRLAELHARSWLRESLARNEYPARRGVAR